MTNIDSKATGFIGDGLLGLSPGLTKEGYLSYGEYLRKKLDMIDTNSLAVDWKPTSKSLSNKMTLTLGKYNSSAI